MALFNGLFLLNVHAIKIGSTRDFFSTSPVIFYIFPLRITNPFMQLDTLDIWNWAWRPRSSSDANYLVHEEVAYRVHLTDRYIHPIQVPFLLSHVHPLTTFHRNLTVTSLSHACYSTHNGL